MLLAKLIRQQPRTFEQAPGPKTDMAPINAAFTPAPEAIARARAIVKLFADNPGQGALSMDGNMVDIPHLKHAERVLARASL